MTGDAMPAAAGGSARLVPLRTLDRVRLAEGEPDVHGWDVVAPDGGRIGRVEELLVDTATDEVAAIAVTAGRDTVVVPMERTRIDPRQGLVVAHVTRDEFADLPRAAAPAAPTAAAAARHPGVTVERTADGEEVITVPIVREELVVERRPVVKEVVVIRKRAEYDERVIEADLRRERIEVDRSGVDPGVVHGDDGDPRR